MRPPDAEKLVLPAELESLFEEALRRGVAKPGNVDTMRRNVESGRFTADHYIGMWRGRLGMPAPAPAAAAAATPAAASPPPAYQAPTYEAPSYSAPAPPAPAAPASFTPGVRKTPFQKSFGNVTPSPPAASPVASLESAWSQPAASRTAGPIPIHIEYCEK